MQIENNNRHVYESPMGEALVVSEKLPSEIQEYLADEESLVRSIALHSQALIEVGCMWGRYAPMAHREACVYLGLDVSAPYIEQARTRFPASEKGRISFLHKDFGLATDEILDHLHRARVPPDRCAAVFPFNVIGNITDIARTTDVIRSLGIQAFVFTYQDHPAAIETLSAYYRSARMPVDRLITADDHIRFESSGTGFSSLTYRIPWFTTYFPDCTIRDFGTLGRLVFVNAPESLSDIGLTPSVHLPRS